MTEDMPRQRFPNLRHEKSRHGKDRWYYREGNGPRIRLLAPYGSPAFKAEYAAAQRGQPAGREPAPEGGTIAWVISKYTASGKFVALAPSTQYFRNNFLKQMVKKVGPKPITSIKKTDIQKSMEARAKTPHHANNFLSAVSQFFDWAVDHKYVSQNPCDGVKTFRARIGGHHTWTVAEVEKYRAHHPIGTRARLALDLLLFVGLRISDLVVLGRQHVKGGVISIQTQKTKVWVHIPVFAELRHSIASTKTGDLAFLVAERGLPFQGATSFGPWFRKRCDEAGLKHCSAHGLRKAGATIAANEGASARELMAMFGWTKMSMAELYTRDAEKRRLAHSAAERIANSFLPHPASGAADVPANAVENKGV